MTYALWWSSHPEQRSTRSDAEGREVYGRMVRFQRGTKAARSAHGESIAQNRRFGRSGEGRAGSASLLTARLPRSMR